MSLKAEALWSIFILFIVYMEFYKFILVFRGGNSMYLINLWALMLKRHSIGNLYQIKTKQELSTSCKAFTS